MASVRPQRPPPPRRGGGLARYHYDLTTGRCIVLTEVRHPDGGAVEGDAERANTGFKPVQHGAIAGPQPGHGIDAIADNPDVQAIERHPGSSIADREDAELRTVRGSELGHGTVEEARDPNVLAVEGSAERAATRVECSDHRARGPGQLRHVLTQVVGNPEVGTVPGAAEGPRPADWERRQTSAIASPDLRDRVVVAVQDPDIGAIRNQPAVRITDGEGSLHGAVRGPQLGNGIGPEIRHPHRRTVRQHGNWTLADGEAAGQIVSHPNPCHGVDELPRDPDKIAVERDGFSPAVRFHS